MARLEQIDNSLGKLSVDNRTPPQAPPPEIRRYSFVVGLESGQTLDSFVSDLGKFTTGVVTAHGDEGHIVIDCASHGPLMRHFNSVARKNGIRVVSAKRVDARGRIIKQLTLPES